MGPGLSLVLFLNGSAGPGWSQVPQGDLEIKKKHTKKTLHSVEAPEACSLGEGPGICRFKEGTDVDKITNAKLCMLAFLLPRSSPILSIF